jgi:hypothetical protein
MEDIKSLVTKHTANESADKWKNSPNSQPTLTPRQLAIVALMQQTQKRRGLPLIAAGFELQATLKAWESALQNVSDSHLSRAYNRAAENWPWADKAFIPDAVADAYKLLVVEDRQAAEAQARNAARRSPDTYRCFHCMDIGYQPVYSYQRIGWYLALRPCCCESTPPAQRQEFALSMEFVRNNRGEYVRLTDIEKYGVPNDSFKEFIVTPN